MHTPGARHLPGATLFAALLLVVMAGCGTVPVANVPPAEVAIERSWSGEYPVARLELLPEGQRQSGAGYLGSTAAFAPVWNAFRPGEAVPMVDFSRQMVVFHRNVDFHNRTRILKVTQESGVVSVLAAETMSAVPVTDKVAMALAVIPRAGLQAIQAGTVRIPVRRP